MFGRDGATGAVASASIAGLAWSWLFVCSCSLTDTNYVKVDGVTPLMTTNSAGIFPFGTLANAPDCGGCFTWTGLNGGWTSNFNTCNNWTDGTAGSVSPDGDPGQTGFQAISNGAPTCNNFRGIYCVEQ